MRSFNLFVRLAITFLVFSLSRADLVLSLAAESPEMTAVLLEIEAPEAVAEPAAALEAAAAGGALVAAVALGDARFWEAPGAAYDTTFFAGNTFFTAAAACLPATPACTAAGADAFSTGAGAAGAGAARAGAAGAGAAGAGACLPFVPLAPFAPF